MSTSVCVLFQPKTSTSEQRSNLRHDLWCGALHVANMYVRTCNVREIALSHFTKYGLGFDGRQTRVWAEGINSSHTQAFICISPPIKFSQFAN